MKYILAALFTVISFAASAQNKNIKTESFKVFGTCSQCKSRIEKAMKSMNVYKANWSIETKMLTVSYDSLKLSKTQLSKKLASVGHDTEEFQADENTYKSLPECCYYERYVKPAAAAAIADTTYKVIVPAMETQTITGVILEENKKGKLSALANATVVCLNTKHTTSSDSMGVFRLECNIPIQLAISYVGFKTDTVNIISSEQVKIILKNAVTSKLTEVVVNSKRPSTYISSLSTLNTLNIGSKELVKAACCNLSESFETSPSVDVSYADAVTGIRQIQLLGLSGNYTQITTENTPEIRGLAGSYGLTFIPGPWIEGIQVTKGTGSVANGSESIAGQINVEEKKPDKMDRLFINAYANNLGRMETSIDLSQRVNDKWSTALFTHVNGVAAKTDDNKDGFLDIPLGRQFNVINRWKYADTKGIFAQFAIKVLNDHRQAGQLDFNPSTDKLTTNKYGVGINVEQYIFTGKLGYVFPQQKYKSIGFIFSANTYNNDSYYGLTKYDGKQQSVYANLIYQSIIGTTVHKFRTGLSFVNDVFNEKYNATNFKRRETVPGTFFEYTYTPGKKFTAVAGVRLDYHNEYKWIATPRLHLKYDFSPKTNLRFSVGSGFRTANVFAENAGLFASSRVYTILNPSTAYGYGLDPERSWNYGVNFVRNFILNSRSGSFSIDAYHTSFTHQVVVDIDANPQKIFFYNLKGRSFSNSVQMELNYEFFPKFDVRLAYRWLDVQTNYNGLVLDKPLIAKHRAFVNLAYETKDKWKFDFTTQWFSKKRLPYTGSNPSDKQMGDYSPDFLQMAAQVTKQLGSKWDLYVGTENLTNYMQGNPIVSAADPFSPYFDGSIIWGPVNGRVLYAGLRFKIK
ncbi:TonB-dependent receptor [Ferruginibacter lapsinanis]|uniref:TonB-dependent receptor domain-containing protein n=1 Tax=Ferruginibacter lapsinanis TaxID=563172 RepID=UPI001E508F81|nr:TonB-dependent receptor [Ferruginibacter lapsinanis]UEG48663.1 TonB-dependent receptor [Ferruginibacter lapsinanis]